MLGQREAVRRAAEMLGRQLPLSVAHIDGLPDPAFEIVREEIRPKNSRVS